MKPPPTSFHAPWALIRRGGALDNGTPFTRIAYLVETIAPEGFATAVRGYVMNDSLTGWTKTLRRIEWVDIIQTWRRPPSRDEIRSAKEKFRRTVRRQAREAARGIVTSESRDVA